MESTPPTNVLRAALPCDVEAPRRARDELRRIDELAPVLDDALLVVSELVTNAVTHSACDTIVVTAELRANSVVLAVHDPGSSARASAVSPPEVGGRGLRIVEYLARRWGILRPDARYVWAELAL